MVSAMLFVRDFLSRTSHELLWNQSHLMLVGKNRVVG